MLVALVVLVFAVGATHYAEARILDPLHENIEVMMRTQDACGSSLARIFGTDETSPISFTSQTDTASQAFSFSSIPGSQYLSQDLYITASGSYNDTLELWEMLILLELGDSLKTGWGTGQVDSFGISQDEGNYYIELGHYDWRVRTAYQGVPWIYVESIEFIEFTYKGVVRKTGQAVDTIYADGTRSDWHMLSYSIEVDAHGVESVGTVDHLTGDGTFTMEVKDFDASSVKRDPSVEVAGLMLDRNCPNPFGPSTAIRYRLPEDGHARVAVYDMTGRLVTTLMDAVRSRGEHTVHWDGRDARGSRAAPGAYVVRLEYKGYVRAQKVLLVK
jgi:hypothetical protein